MGETATSTESPATSRQDGKGSSERATPAARRRLPDERHSLTHHFSVGGQEGYVTIGLYEDGLPGEMFIRMSKEGSTVSGLMDSFATAISWLCSMGYLSRCCAASSVTHALSRAAGLGTHKSDMPSRSWTTCSGGLSCAFSKPSKEAYLSFRRLSR